MDFHAWEAIIANWPNDWIIIGAFTVFIALDALRSGAARAASIALALPVTLLIVNTIPQAFFLGPFSAQYTAPLLHAGIFLGLFVLLYMTTHRTIYAFSTGGGVVQALIAGVTTVIILVIVWLQVPALEAVWHFGPQVQAVFGPAYRFWLLLAAFIGLSFSRS